MSCEKCFRVMWRDYLKTHMKHEAYQVLYQLQYMKLHQLKKKELRKRGDKDYKYKLAQGKILYQCMYDIDNNIEESLHP